MLQFKYCKALFQGSEVFCNALIRKTKQGLILLLNSSDIAHSVAVGTVPLLYGNFGSCEQPRFRYKPGVQ